LTGEWILVALFVTSVAIGCGAGASTRASTSPGGDSSAVGTYNVLVTATSPASVQTLTIPVTLAKQQMLQGEA